MIIFLTLLANLISEFITCFYEFGIKQKVILFIVSAIPLLLLAANAARIIILPMSTAVFYISGALVSLEMLLFILSYLTTLFVWIFALTKKII